MMYGLPLVPRDVRVAPGPRDVRVASGPRDVRVASGRLWSS